MEYDFKLINSIDIKAKLVSKFCCQVSDDDFISIVTDKGILIFKLHSYKHNTLPIFSYIKTLIPTSSYILSQNLELKIDTFVSSMNKNDLFESVLRTDISGCIDTCAKNISISAIASKWSRANAIGSQSVLAVLTDAGSVDLYIKIVKQNTVNNYYHLENITTKHIELFRKDWNLGTLSLEEMKLRLDMHTPTAFTWTHSLSINASKFCNIIVAHINGKIVFWKFLHLSIERYKLAKVIFLDVYDTNMRNITTMHWIESFNNSGLLALGNLAGKVIIYPVLQNSQTTVRVGKGIIFNNEDNVKVDYIFSSLQGSSLFIYVIKQATMIIYLLKDGSLKDSCIFEIGNLGVNGIRKYCENTILVCTESGTFKELLISATDDDKIDLNWRHIYINMQWSQQKPVGFFSSKNNSIFTLITDTCKLYNLKEEKDYVNFFTFVNKGVKSLDLLLNNNTNSLKDYHDCLEAVRVDSLISKELICKKTPISDLDNLNLLQLKTLLFFSKIDEHIGQQLDTVPPTNMKDYNDIFIIIEIKLAVYYAQLILEQMSAGKTVSDFKSQCIRILLSYLKETVISDNLVKLNLGANCVDEILDIVTRCDDIPMQQTPPCFICGEDILGSFCVSCHTDNRCLISMMQIVHPKYICPCCKHYVSEEALKDFQVYLCPLCDHQLDLMMAVDKVTQV